MDCAKNANQEAAQSVQTMVLTALNVSKDFTWLTTSAKNVQDFVKTVPAPQYAMSWSFRTFLFCYSSTVRACWQCVTAIASLVPTKTPRFVWNAQKVTF
jgi:hypothetical protein